MFRVFVAVPAMDEAALPQMLLSLNRQRHLPEAVFVCINQPEAYYRDGVEEHARVCRRNAEVFEGLQRMVSEGCFAFPLFLLDRFSPGKAWDDRHFGVGWARKVAMDAASDYAVRLDGCSGNGQESRASTASTASAAVGDRILLACMDADTAYPEAYLADMCAMFEAYPQAVALANPYYHFLEDGFGKDGCLADCRQARALLHYEVYMRAYALNMMRTCHPYAFTAVGSSMACTLAAYRKIGGISPFKSGEDFYFLQKLAKTGAVLRYSPSVSHPSGRLSTRVFFGTGPALCKGVEDQWQSYPIYPMALFGRMQAAYEALPDLYDGLCRGLSEGELAGCGPVFDFWTLAFGADWWKPIKAHCGGRKPQFVRSCMEKFDALRSLQFLKASYGQDDRQDWLNLRELCRVLRDELGLQEGFEGVLEAADWAAVAWDAGRQQALGRLIGAVMPAGGSLETMPEGGKSSLRDLSLEDWELLRDFLFLCERKMQKERPLLRFW